ncbi:MAG: hypothetical protein ACRDQ4_10175 [Pseudonocardiaceae bacterium]
MTIIIDTLDRIATSFDIVDELTAEHGVVPVSWCQPWPRRADPYRRGNHQ